MIDNLADPRLSDLSDGSTILLATPPGGIGDSCISNSGMLSSVIILFICFSLAVQMSEGLCYGVVPYVSRPALGVESGMVGAGGNAGSLITNAAFFLDPTARHDTGFLNMGITIIAITCLCFFIYFPEHGSMLTPAGKFAKYDPQLIKPPKGYRGADSMNYAATEDKAVKDSGVDSTTKGNSGQVTV
jgi:NNP family nitrate/nitrite transporter-like MFS transporter